MYYDLLCAQLKGLAEAERWYVPLLANASALIYDNLEDLNWAGFYLLREGRLVLGPFQGKLACIHIPVGKGVCGTAVARDETLLVPDVHAFPGHIACDSASNSEIVIPIHAPGGGIFGVLDIDSPVPDRFTEEDRTGLEAFVRELEAALRPEDAEEALTVRPMAEKYRRPALDLVQQVFTEHDGPGEGQTVRRLVEEIRAKAYYVPELELVMTDAADDVVGYAMFSRFHLEGRYDRELLLLSPVAVKTDMQRRHISKRLIEYGFERARELGFRAVIVEGDPRNYRARGFETSADHGIVAGPSIHLPHVSCLMVRELVPGALEHIRGQVDYSMYEALRQG